MCSRISSLCLTANNDRSVQGRATWKSIALLRYTERTEPKHPVLYIGFTCKLCSVAKLTQIAGDKSGALLEGGAWGRGSPVKGLAPCGPQRPEV